MSELRTRGRRRSIGYTGLGVTAACLAILNASRPASADDGIRHTESPTYALVDVGALPDYDHSKAFGVNNAGEIVGVSTNDIDLGPNRAFIWRDGDMMDLGTLGGDGASAAAVNEAGVVVGAADMEPGLTPPAHAFLWEDDMMDDLGTLGGSASWALDVNAFSMVVGGSRLLGDTLFHPTLWIGGTPQDLGLLPDHWVGDARAINASGTIVGYSTSVFAEARAVVWGDGIQNLGTLPGGCCSEAFDINETGQIVGFSWIGGASGYHAFLWEDGLMTDLGTLQGGANSRAYALNASGQVVGTSWTSSDYPGNPHACLWQAGAALDLNDMLVESTSWILTEARDINDQGMIAVTGIELEEGLTHAFLLIPIVALPGDFDADGDVDLDDYAVLWDCMVGPDAIPAPSSVSLQECLETFDLDEDADVDLHDFAGFSGHLTQPG